MTERKAQTLTMSKFASAADYWKAMYQGAAKDRAELKKRVEGNESAIGVAVRSLRSLSGASADQEFIVGTLRAIEKATGKSVEELERQK